MSDFVLYIGTAFALIFVIEGLLYALFPEGIKKMFAVALQLSPAHFRLFGAVMVVTGLCLIGLMSLFAGG